MPPHMTRALRFGIVTALGAALAAASGPLDTLRARDRQLRESLAEAPDEAIRIRAALQGAFDFRTLARLSFGRYWTQMSERDREAACRLVAALVERTAIEKAAEYRKAQPHFVSETINSPQPGAATARVAVATGGKKSRFDLRMRLAGGEWKIVDVVTEGASMAESNRAAFYREIRRSGIPVLLEKLRRQTGAP
jgi:ABC-type transporter MlaC component